MDSPRQRAYDLEERLVTLVEEFRQLISILVTSAATAGRNLKRAT